MKETQKASSLEKVQDRHSQSEWKDPLEFIRRVYLAKDTPDEVKIKGKNKCP